MVAGKRQRGSVFPDRFHAVQFSVQRTHIHLLVEASDRLALAKGMQTYGISAAKHINALILDNELPHSDQGLANRVKDVRLAEGSDRCMGAHDDGDRLGGNLIPNQVDAIP